MSSLASQFIHKIGTPYGTALGLGYTMNTALFWGNIALIVAGPMRILVAHHRRHQVGLNDFVSIKIFAQVYNWAKDYFKPCVIASTLGYAGAAYFESHAAGSASLRPLLCIASACCAFVGPWTLIALMPINNKLIALAETKEISASSETEAKAAMEQFGEWHKRHLVRAVAGGLAWVLGTIALILL